jgi:uncharacterized membrane protein YuzA (DUF378 family)
MYIINIFGKNTIVFNILRRFLKMAIIKRVAYILMIIGALVWGMVGLFNFNLVAFIFDNISVIISRIIYSLVGVAGVISLISLFLPDDEF